MPIANCYISEIIISESQLQQLTVEWAESINVDVKDVSLTFVEIKVQTGQKYKVMVNLFLPSLWSDSNIYDIQNKLLENLIRHLNLNSSEIFIITNIVQSGNVVENGEIVKWD